VPVAAAIFLAIAASEGTGRFSAIPYFDFKGIFLGNNNFSAGVLILFEIFYLVFPVAALLTLDWAATDSAFALVDYPVGHSGHLLFRFVVFKLAI